MKKIVILVVLLSALLMLMAMPVAAVKPEYGSDCTTEQMGAIEAALASCTGTWRNHGEKVSCASQAVWGALGYCDEYEAGVCDETTTPKYEGYATEEDEACASSVINYWARNAEPTP